MIQCTTLHSESIQRREYQQSCDSSPYQTDTIGLKGSVISHENLPSWSVESMVPNE